MNISSNAEEFNNTLKKWCESTKWKADAFWGKFCFNLSRRVYSYTPKITGHLQRSWFQGWGSPPSGEAGKGGLAATIQTPKFGTDFFFANFANYAYFVEFGTSRMSPRAMVRTAVNQAPQAAEETLREVQKT